MSNFDELIDNYVGVWNERDAGRRREIIAQLWARDSAHFTKSLEARGYEAIEARVTKAHEQFVVAGGYLFKAATNNEEHHNVVRFNWQMVPAAGGPAVSTGAAFLILGDDGRIRTDYQFTDAPPK